MGPQTPTSPYAQVGWQSVGLQLEHKLDLDVSPEEREDSGIPGESPIVRDIEAFVRSPLGPRVQGLFTATTYQITFTPNSEIPTLMGHLHSAYFSLPISSIRRIDRSSYKNKSDGTGTMMDIVSKDVRILSIGFKSEGTTELIESRLRALVYPGNVNHLFAFYSGANGQKVSPVPLPGWDVYDFDKEMTRLGVYSLRHPISKEPLFRPTDTNRSYGMCPTYPSRLIVPARAADPFISVVAGFRSKGRIPTLTWLHPGNKTSLWRCSQPRVGVSGKTCPQDEQMLQMIRETNVLARDGTRKPLLVADCRPRANALANNLTGGGFESYAGTELVFMNIHNIHVVRDAHKKMENLSLQNLPQSDVGWLQGLHDSSWYQHMRTLLSAGLFCAEAMHRRGLNVLVHCSDGWDRTAQVCCLVQIFLDPYARTVRGFCSLIAKEWCSFGHKFGERTGQGSEKEDGDVSPIFVQFLDAIWQLLQLFPGAFEFNEKMLLTIAHHLFSCRFGTFIGNNERERMELRLPHRTQSLWGYLLDSERVREFVNPRFDPDFGDVFLPFPSMVLRNLQVWSHWFLRWAPCPSFPNSLVSEKYPDDLYNREALAAALQSTSEVPSKESEMAAADASQSAVSSARTDEESEPSSNENDTKEAPSNEVASTSSTEEQEVDKSPESSASEDDDDEEN